MRLHFFRGLALLALIATSTSPIRAGEDYFVLMFGSQRIPNNPNHTHTFATFVKATWQGDGCCPHDAALESITISWLPCNGIVRVHALLPEPGRNYDLHETFRWAMDDCQRISMWGAYRIDCELYGMAMRQFNHLRSGKVMYKCNDTGWNTEYYSNCIHAVGNVAGGRRIRVLTPGWGEVASYAVLLRFRPWIVSRDTHTWVGSALGLDQYPIIYRDFEGPHSGYFFGPLYRVLGGERDLQATYGPPVK